MCKDVKGRHVHVASSNIYKSGAKLIILLFLQLLYNNSFLLIKNERILGDLVSVSLVFEHM